MTNTDKLIEAITYSSDNNQEWWEAFDSFDEALEIINNVLEENPSEYEIAYILSTIEDEDFFNSSLKKSFRRCILALKKRLLRSQAEGK